MGSRRGPVRHPAEVARHLLAASQADREPPREYRAVMERRTVADAAKRAVPGSRSRAAARTRGAVRLEDRCATHRTARICR
jgi:hypothetical protein